MDHANGPNQRRARACRGRGGWRRWARHPSAWACVWLLIGAYEGARAADPGPPEASTAAALDEADWASLVEDPDALGRLRERLADYAEQHGADPGLVGLPEGGVRLGGNHSLLVDDAILKQVRLTGDPTREWVVDRSDSYTLQLKPAVHDPALNCPTSQASGAVAEAVKISTRLKQVGESIGRIAVDGHASGRFLGTGFVVVGGWVVTAKHVLTDSHLVEGSAADGYTLTDDLTFEQTDVSGALRLVSELRRDQLVMVPDADIAALVIDTDAANLRPIAVRSSDWLDRAMHAPAPLDIAVLGYPYSLDIDEMAKVSVADRQRAECLFGAIHGQPFIAVGPTLGVLTSPGVAFLHGASTIEGASGSPVVDLASGEVIGVHACSTAFGAEACFSDGVPIGEDALLAPPRIVNVGWSLNTLCHHAPLLCSPT